MTLFKIPRQMYKAEGTEEQQQLLLKYDQL